YKAGRYGVGPSTEKILQSLGYSIDASVLPHTNLIAEEGPNFEGLPDQPYWFGERLELLEVSLTRGFHGKLAPWGGEIFSVIGRPWGQKAHLPGMFSRLGLLERITLTPEGISYKELVRLTRSLLRQERKIFCFTYHSSTLLPGANTYVRDRQDLDAFLETMDRYFEFFMTEIGGRPSTLLELRSQIRNGDVDNKQKDRVRQAAN
ncbi:MAG: hypothetical protein QF491_05525, partial [Alphaproteobacteria bacterium]|nr:hypothetical protein [Alphaproteobacteria bacterium]